MKSTTTGPFDAGGAVMDVGQDDQRRQIRDADIPAHLASTLIQGHEGRAGTVRGRRGILIVGQQRCMKWPSAMDCFTRTRCPRSHVEQDPVLRARRARPSPTFEIASFGSFLIAERGNYVPRNHAVQPEGSRSRPASGRAPRTVAQRASAVCSARRSVPVRDGLAELVADPSTNEDDRTRSDRRSAETSDAVNISHPEGHAGSSLNAQFVGGFSRSSRLAGAATNRPSTLPMCSFVIDRTSSVSWRREIPPR